jgi:hypothetical protein
MRAGRTRAGRTRVWAGSVRARDARVRPVAKRTTRSKSCDLDHGRNRAIWTAGEVVRLGPSGRPRAGPPHRRDGGPDGGSWAARPLRGPRIKPLARPGLLPAGQNGPRLCPRAKTAGVVAAGRAFGRGPSRRAPRWSRSAGHNLTSDRPFDQSKMVTGQIVSRSAGQRLGSGGCARCDEGIGGGSRGFDQRSGV